MLQCEIHNNKRTNVYNHNIYNIMCILLYYYVLNIASSNFMIYYVLIYIEIEMYKRYI